MLAHNKGAIQEFGATGFRMQYDCISILRWCRAWWYVTITASAFITALFQLCTWLSQTDANFTHAIKNEEKHTHINMWCVNDTTSELFQTCISDIISSILNITSIHLPSLLHLCRDMFLNCYFLWFYSWKILLSNAGSGCLVPARWLTSGLAWVVSVF